MRTLLQTVGAAFLLAGSFLLFFPASNTSEQTDERITKELAATKKENDQLKQEIQHLKSNQLAVENDEKTSDGQRPKAKVKTIIAIEQGSDSTTVAKSLEEAGIIEQAKAFNDYLVDHGFASKIRIGEYEVNETMDFQQIAETITQKK